MTKGKRPAEFIAGACGAASFPENTVEAFRRCLDLPVDGIEADLHLSADGVVIAHHDERLKPDRTRRDGAWIEAPGPRIKDLTAAELARCDVGAARDGAAVRAEHPHRAHWDGAFIPTLRSLLEVARAAARPPLFYAELKTNPQAPDDGADPQALVEAVLAELAAARWMQSARVIAFDWRVLRLTRGLSPEVKTAHLVVPRALEHRVARDAAGHSPWTDGFDPARFGGSVAAAIAAHGGAMASYYHKDVTPAVIDDAARSGIAVAAWGLSDAADISAMLNLGVASVTIEGPAWGPF